MKKSHYLLTALIVVLVGISAFFMGTRTGDRLDDASGRATSNMASNDREILYWRAPMDATEIYDQPGTSRMGMDLEPVYADDAEGVESDQSESAGTVRINPVVAQNMGIRYGVAERRDLSRSIRTVGEIMVDEENLVQVSARVSGWVEVLHVAFEGAPVSKGDPLLELYAPELVTTQEEFLLALSHRDALGGAASAEARTAADRLIDAVRTRLRNWDLSEEFIAQVEADRTVRRRVTIEAPITGVVLSKGVTEGARIQSGQELYRLADLRQVWIHASFYDFELPWLSVGQKADIELSYLPGVRLTGEVSYIYPFLRQKARDVHVRLIVANPDLQLKPGMFANVELAGSTLEDVVVVPSAAVIRSGERSLLFVDSGEGRVDPREVQLGAEADDLVHVIAGVEAGERIVISSQFLIDSESRLQEAIDRMRGTSQNANETELPGEAMPADSASMTDHNH